MTTTRLPPDFKEFLKLLKARDVRFLLVGGYAVNAYGYIRNTVDLDIWVAPDQENRHRVINAIREFGFATAPLDALDGDKAMLRMGVPPIRIEVMVDISGIQFEDCWPRRVELQCEESAFPMISLEDLKANTLASARPKDLVDLSELP